MSYDGKLKITSQDPFGGSLFFDTPNEAAVVPPPVIEDYLLQEDGFYLLQENGFRIIIT